MGRAHCILNCHLNISLAWLWTVTGWKRLVKWAVNISAYWQISGWNKWTSNIWQRTLLKFIFLSSMQHPLQVPCQVAHCLVTYSLPCNPGPYSLAAVFQSIAHGRSGRLAQQVEALYVDVEKQAHSRISFVSFQIYLRVFKVDRCWGRCVICYPSCSSPESLLWEMPVVCEVTAGYMCSYRAFLLQYNLSDQSMSGSHSFHKKGLNKCWVELKSTFHRNPYFQGVTEVCALQLAVSCF